MNEKLVHYVAQNVKNVELANLVMTVIAAFETAAEEFRLAKAADLDREKAIEALALLSQRPVEKIETVSADDPRLAVRDGEVASDLTRNTEESLWERLFSRNHHTLWEELGRDRGNQLMCLLENDLVKLTDRLVASCVKSGGYDLRRTVQRHLYHPLAYFIGFAVSGNAERVNRIRPVLMLMLRGIIPIAETKGASRTWYVLTE